MEISSDGKSQQAGAQAFLLQGTAPSTFRVFAATQSAAPRLDQVERIAQLRQQRRAVILAHYYQDDAIQDIADFIGDSLELSRKAANTDAEVIVFCGVHSWRRPPRSSAHKTVVLPDLNAGYPLADACPADGFAQFKAEHPDHVVISYINCSAAIKAQSDLICTSSNAVAMVQSVPREQPILFAPDQNLLLFVASGPRAHAVARQLHRA